MAGKSTSPTARSMAWLREQGYVVAKVEQRLPHAFITRDLFNLFDLLAMRPNAPLLGVQVTTVANQASRRRKLQESGHLATWLSTGALAVVHGWARAGKRGERKTWQVRVWDARDQGL